MNDKQSEIFSRILDLNWEMTQENKDFTRKVQLAKDLARAKDELKEDMGEEAYDTFMNNGKKMFAPLGSTLHDDVD